MDVRVFKGRRGITGLETAIILIAFVIVASVFAFTVLNMGFLTTQTAQSTIQSGTQQAASSIQLAGAVIAYDTNDDDKVDKIEIYVKLSPGKQAVDLSEGKLIVSYTNA
ncbi:MAG TPA: flagellin, partial [Candidatus Bathyarchaeota archaeon]|nr:flagellin [Candidatus Bathyarchaeota archaeon]